MKASSAPCSRACTSPRCRSGSAISGLRRTAPDHRQAERLDRRAAQPLVALARHLVQHDAGDAHPGIVAGEAAGDRRHRLRLPRDVEHQEHRHAPGAREVGRRPAPPRRRGHPVEEPHRALDDEDVRLRLRRGEVAEEGRRHRPAVEVDPRRAGRRGMERRVDVVRPRLRPAHDEPAAGEGAHQADGDAGLARARARRPDDEGPRAHAGARAAAMSASRSATIAPTTITAGGRTPSSATRAAMVARSATTTRSSGQVAEATTAAGVVRRQSAGDQRGGDLRRARRGPCR